MSRRRVTRRHVLLCLAVILPAVLALALVRDGLISDHAAPVAPAGLPPAADAPAAAPLPPAAAAQAWQAFAAARSALPARRPEVTLFAAGDIMLSRTVAAKIRAEGAAHPFLAMAAASQRADISFANLETPITAGREIHPGEMTFRSDPGLELELKKAGFDVVSLANNHTPNFGGRGLKDTVDLLDAAGIAHAGAGQDAAEAFRPALVQAGGLTFAFLAYNDPGVVPAAYGAAAGHAGTAFMDPARLPADIAAARAQADVVIVSMHAGTEYAAKPNDQQVAFAHAAIDAGADLVLGHHPHVVQTAEIYKGKFIFYSLGNFIFDQDWSRETQDGLAVVLQFQGNLVERADLLPVTIADQSQPRPAAGADADRIIRRLGLQPQTRPAWVWDQASGSYVRTVDQYLANSSPPAASRLSAYFGTPAGAAGPDPKATFELNGGAATVAGPGGYVWRTPDRQWTDALSLADVDGDGRSELVLNVWRAGSFGAEKPFWVTADTPAILDHVFVYGWTGGQLAAKWQSSALSSPNCASALADLDGDGRDELVVLEGEYGSDDGCQGRSAAVWKWQDWGFVNVWRGPQGAYDDLSLGVFGGQPGFSARQYPEAGQ